MAQLSAGMPEDKSRLRHAMRGEEITGTFQIAYKSAPGAANPGAHIHPQYELLLCLSDDMFCHLGDHRIDVCRDTLMLFNNMDLHFFGPDKKDGENLRWVVYFDPELITALSTPHVNLLDCFLYRPREDANILRLTAEESEQLQRLFRQLATLDKAKESACYGKELKLNLLLAEILLEVNRLYKQYYHIAMEFHPEKHRTVYAIMEYIHENYQEKLSLDHLAQAFYINKFTICELFREILGTSPNQYIINCRIQKAKELLLSGHTVDVACALTGFNNLSHFSRSFKTRTGLSPKQYQMLYAHGRQEAG